MTKQTEALKAVDRMEKSHVTLTKHAGLNIDHAKKWANYNANKIRAALQSQDTDPVRTDELTTNKSEALNIFKACKIDVGQPDYVAFEMSHEEADKVEQALQSHDGAEVDELIGTQWLDGDGQHCVIIRKSGANKSYYGYCVEQDDYDYWYPEQLKTLVHDNCGQRQTPPEPESLHVDKTCKENANSLTGKNIDSSATGCLIQTKPEQGDFTQEKIDDYIDGYEMRGDEAYYSPNNQERFLIRDAIYGFIADYPQALTQAQPVDVEALEREIKTVLNTFDLNGGCGYLARDVVKHLTTNYRITKG